MAPCYRDRNFSTFFPSLRFASGQYLLGKKKLSERAQKIHARDLRKYDIEGTNDVTKETKCVRPQLEGSFCREKSCFTAFRIKIVLVHIKQRRDNYFCSEQTRGVALEGKKPPQCFHPLLFALKSSAEIREFLLWWALSFHTRLSPMKGTTILIFILLVTASPTGQSVSQSRHALDSSSWGLAHLILRSGKLVCFNREQWKRLAWCFYGFYLIFFPPALFHQEELTKWWNTWMWIYTPYSMVLQIIRADILRVA